MQLTAKGRALNAKIQAGLGTVPLEITRFIATDALSKDPLNIMSVVGTRQTGEIMRQMVSGGQAEIAVRFTNQGNEAAGEAPLAVGYAMGQILCMANDPDEGEIIYRVSQFNPKRNVPAAWEMGWRFEPTWVITIENADDVDIIVNVTHGMIEMSDTQVPGGGVLAHLRIVQGVPEYRPFTGQEWPPTMAVDEGGDT
jgi:hypothetical protein